MSDNLCIVSVEDGVGVVRLDRPPANAFNIDLVNRLHAAVDELQSNDEARAVVFCASGKFFSAGADIELINQGGWEYLKELVEVGHRLWEKIENMPKFAVAAIEGHCMGGAFEFVLACDRRIMATGKPSIGLPETKIGLMPGWGASWRLPKLIGKSKALDMIARGAVVRAEQALELGIVDEIHPPEEVFDKSMEYARAIAHGPTVALGGIKRCVNGSSDLGYSEVIRLETEGIKAAFHSEDFKEGAQAFAEKRAPNFKGK